MLPCAKACTSSFGRFLWLGWPTYSRKGVNRGSGGSKIGTNEQDIGNAVIDTNGVNMWRSLWAASLFYQNRGRKLSIWKTLVYRMNILTYVCKVKKSSIFHRKVQLGMWSMCYVLVWSSAYFPCYMIALWLSLLSMKILCIKMDL